MHVTAAESTELFTGPSDDPLQIVQVAHSGGGGVVRVVGAGLTGQAQAGPGEGIVEVPVHVADPVVGQARPARALSGSGSVDFDFDFVVAEPGWTMHMVSHFHYDPVWWNTQGAYTSRWTEEPPGRCRQTNGFDLVSAHLEMARREPEYKFVLAEVDYLKPFWDTHPEERADLRRLIAEGRVEIMGGTYNEPNTNLTGPETAIRNFVHGIGFQRDILGANPATAWQLDVFGHDPQFPAMAADAGLTSSSWARGPHHQWGPMAREHDAAGDPARMQFASEFEWLAPSGRGLLTHYMPAHYAAGWWMDSAASLQDAELATYQLFTELKKVALTRNVLLPVGTDYTPPNKWVTDIHRDWNARYTWPRFVCALPGDFFAAVRAELHARGAAPSPQTRDMNPIYTGKDVSYIDTKQANRAAEQAVLAAERFAAFAGLLTGATYPEAALAKAWVQLAYGAHHDAITGSESDQVYLDLLTSWRDAWQLGTGARDRALTLLSSAVEARGAGSGEPPGGAAIVVWNPLGHSRSDIVTVHLDEPVQGHLVGDDGAAVPAVIDHGGHSLTFLAAEVPSLGWRSFRLRPGAPTAAWEPLADGATPEIANTHYRLCADPARGGAVSSLVADGRELIAAGRVGNELAVYDEYPAHPTAGEGPWHLLPKGPVTTSAQAPAASVRCYRSALGERMVVTGEIPGLLTYTQTLTLWQGVDRLDCRTVVDDFTGADRLLRLRWPCPVPGAMPVSEVGDAVIGRGFGLLHQPGPAHDPSAVAGADAVDSAVHPYTLDNPAYGWFGLSSTVRVRFRGGAVRAIAVAEVVIPSRVDADTEAAVRDLMTALARAGVTATCSVADAPRYGDLAVDSNLPDVRISVGDPLANAFTAAVLAGAPGAERVWIPAAEPLAEVWVPGADLRGPAALPVLVVGAAGAAAAAVTALAGDLADAEIEVDQDVVGEHFEPRSVAVVNRGVPGFAVDVDGTMHTSLMRSCTGWPSGTWIDPPRRTAPDGSNFALQHWTHCFDYALVGGDGDWRDLALPARAAEFNQPLIAVPAHHDPARGGLPSRGSLLELEPARAVGIGALKVAGNPTATGSAQHADPFGGIVLRLVERHGRPAEVTVHSGLRDLDLKRLDLTERPLGEPDGPLRLHGYEIATVRTQPNLARVLDAELTSLAPDAEPTQPLYARYWLHNRGPAPLGGLPAVAHLHPHRVSVDGAGALGLRLTAASDARDVALHGRVRLIAPAGWHLEMSELPFVLPAGEHLESAVEVAVPDGVAPGLYPLRAELAATGAAIPASWHQTVEDVCVVSVGHHDDRLLYLAGEPVDVDVVAGATARLSVTVGTDARADLAVEAHAISPWGTWEWLGPNIVGAVLPARGTVELEFDVAPPPWTPPGRWWALIRVAAAGELVYSPAVSVRVGPR